MRPLTAQTPKPLLTVGGTPLLEHHIVRLRAAGVTQMVVNAAYLAEQITDFCGDGARWGVSISLSREPMPLETAGGIIEAMPLLGNAPFLVVNADIYTDFTYASLLRKDVMPACGHLVLVQNPEHNRAGDFSLIDNQVRPPGEHGEAGRGSLACTLTFSGIAVYHPGFFARFERGKRPLKPLLDAAIADHRLSGERYGGLWSDVGTPERLAALEAQVAP
jgi:MurNAc alpha-1-phosphate uridylyltransferase